MNTYKLNLYMSQLVEMFLMIGVCIAEYILIVISGVLVSGVLAYFALYNYYNSNNPQEASAIFSFVAYTIMITLLICLYRLSNVLVSMILKKYLKQYPAIYMAMICQIGVILPVLDIYFGEELFTVGCGLTAVLCLLVYSHYYKKWYKLSKMRLFGGDVVGCR